MAQYPANYGGGYNQPPPPGICYPPGPQQPYYPATMQPSPGGYPPQPGGYYPGQPPTQTIVVQEKRDDGSDCMKDCAICALCAALCCFCCSD